MDDATHGDGWVVFAGIMVLVAGVLRSPELTQLRDAVRADPGWRLVIADVAQLEPRVLAAMAGGKAGERYHRRVDRAGFTD